MTYCQLGNCLCNTVHQESARIWNDLQDADKLASPIHENTITQSFALTLNRQHGAQIRTHTFSPRKEKHNGSDFLWLFFDASLSCYYRVAVQAKRISSNGKYEAFKAEQAKAIVSYAEVIDALPIYIFYNNSVYINSMSSRQFGDCFRWPFYSLLSPMLPQNIGATYALAHEVISNSQQNSLSLLDIALYCRPLWHLFCTCCPSHKGDVLDVVWARLTERFGAEKVDRHEIANETVSRWVNGGPNIEGLDRALINEFTGNSPERLNEQGLDFFDPSFVIATRLGNEG